VTPRPGEMRLWAYQSIAHGADAIVFFRWRTARFGTEQYWHGLLDHDAQRGRRYDEVKRMGAEIKRIGNQIIGSEVKSPIAMLLSYDSRFAFQIQPNNPRFSYPEHFSQVYRAFYRKHISIDIVESKADLSAYKLVIAPALHLLTETCSENLRRYVQAGGILVVTQRTGVKDESNAVVNQRLPGLLAEVCGVEVEEYDSLGSTMQNSLEFVLPELTGKGSPVVGVLCDILRPTSATVVARYIRDFYAGKPAITINSYGIGQAVYVGAVGEGQLYETLAGWLLERGVLKPVLEVPEEIEVTERWQDGKRLIFVLNHNVDPLEITLDARFSELLSGEKLDGHVLVPSREILILADPE
jgi:beta-galactosidase